MPTATPPSPTPPPASLSRVPDAIDASFTVPFRHRLRFTADILGPDHQVLLDLLTPPAAPSGTPAPPARVLAFVESAVDRAAGVADRLRALAAAHPHAIHLADCRTFDGGEPLKNDPRHLLPLLQSLLDAAIDRQSYVLAIGGGAFLDAVGFAAATAHRGVRLIRLPTTTLAQADSGVGVKNAINFFDRKNWLGTFAVPSAVINDARLLQTLPDRDWCAGFSEAVKVSLLKDPAFFSFLCDHAPDIAARRNPASDHAIRLSALWHLRHITEHGDPFETREARPLDFGHWSAHRLESLTRFTLPHGHAVAIGLAIDCAYSRLVHGLPPATESRIRRCLADLGLPLYHPLLTNPAPLLDGLEEFRQHLGGRLTLTMLQDVASPLDVHTIDTTALRHAIASVHDHHP